MVSPLLICVDNRACKPWTWHWIVRGMAWCLGVSGCFSCPLLQNRLLGQDSERLRRELIGQAGPQWQRFRDAAKHLQGTRIHRTDYLNAKGEAPRSREARADLRQNRNGAVLTYHVLEGQEGRAEAIGWNPQYSFRLTRSTNSKEWVLTELDLQNKELAVFLGSSYRAHLDNFISFPLMIHRTAIDSLVADKNLKITHMRKIDRDGRTLAEITFDFPHDITQKPFNPVQRGTMVLDPNALWCVREYKVDAKFINSRSTLTAVNEFDLASGLPVVTKSVRSSISKDTGLVKYTDTYEFELSRPSRDPADQNLSLSAFGLPEPHGVMHTWNRPTRWDLWIYAAAGCCIGGALFFRWRRRKTATAKTAVDAPVAQ